MFRVLLLVILTATPFLVPAAEEAAPRPSLAPMIAFRAGISAGVEEQRCKMHRLRRYIDFASYYSRNRRAYPGHAVEDWLHVPLASEYDPCDRVVEACNEMHSQLDRWWGREKHAIWIGDDYRAQLQASPRSCDLEFRRSVASRKWLSAGDHAEIPVGLVGKPVSWLGRYVPDRTEDGALVYTTAVAGRHISEMSVEIRTDDDIITSVHATGWQSVEGEAEIRELARGLRVRIGHDEHGYLVIGAGASRVRDDDR